METGRPLTTSSATNKVSYLYPMIFLSLEGPYPFLNKKFKDFSRTFKDTFPIFPFSAEKSLESMSFLVLLQHEKFYPLGPFVFASFSLEFCLNYEVSIEMQGLLNSSRKDSHVKGARILVGELV